jgi:hypothetical protein
MPYASSGMSFLIDPPLLFASGAAIDRIAPDEDAARKLELLTIAGFWGVAMSMYANAAWTRWMYRPFGSASGRDWMLNSGVFHFRHGDDAPARTHLAAAALFATYPLWLRLGRRVAHSAAAPELD